ncbi:hypothetical protein FSW04_01675 [Baekduia soli]|uniref:NAD(P)-binding domain-containing protein n=1 Tax=Baekduia soli TaxID=496014 RepID=A0A5B8U0A3_9ACTN|nr:low temperature requirement protein A [Baekduia soli]QEC46414.1 hypothetical protein FSW04_01675 [Baekduia soli]
MNTVRPPRAQRLRPRGDGVTQPTTTVELFFDLVYVFAITQLSHLILDDPSVAGIGRAAFLLLIVWWAWIYTTWMVNWFDPGSPAVRAVLTGVMLASLLMAAALPGAFGADGTLFAAAYVVLQVGRNAAAALLLRRGEPLRDIFERLVGWSAVSGALWLAGSALPGDRRLLLWVPAVVLDLCAPAAGYWLPGRGRAATSDYDIEGGHFTERCEAFIIIALGESIVVTGATAAGAGLDATVVLCLGVAFLETAALWWLYFGVMAERSREVMRTCADPGRLARDAYTYLHLPIVAGVIAVAVGDDLLIKEPGRALHGAGLAMVLGGPALYLIGEALFRLRLTGSMSTERLAVAALLLALAPAGGRLSALALSAVVAAVLSALALWELRGTRARPAGDQTGARHGRARGACRRSSTSSPPTGGNDIMKIVVIGGSGRVGGSVVRRLVARGHDPVPASPSTGVDTITGEGLADVMAGADAVVDVSNAPVWEDDAVREFFTTSTRNLLAAEREAGVGHHLAVSIVGCDRLPDSGYLRAKVAQEAEIEAGGIPYTILRATQFFEFLAQIVDSGAEGDQRVRLSNGLMQLVAADDVAATVAELATGGPVGGHVELGGPEALGIDAWARRLFTTTGDQREVVSDPHARYFGTELTGDELTPGDGARIGATDYETWWAAHMETQR